MKDSDLQRIRHVHNYCVDVATTIERFGKSLDLFLSDRDFFNSVSMSLLQIGELATGLSPEFRDFTKERIQWSLIRGMRNWLAHAYGDVSREIIWNAATEDVPVLLSFCFPPVTGQSQSHRQMLYR